MKEKEIPLEAENDQYEINRLRHIIGVQREQYRSDLESLEKLLDKYKKENEQLKAYIKALVNRNLFHRIRNTQPSCEQS